MLIPNKVLEIAKVASTDKTRYVLNAIHVFRDEAGKPVAESCDGRRALRVRWTEDGGEEFPIVEGATAETVKGFDCLVSTDGLDAVKRSAPKRPCLPIFGNVLLDEVKTSKNGHAYITTGEPGRFTSTTVGKVDGVFPDMKQIMERPKGRPSGKPDFRIKLNAELLAGLLMSISRLNPGSRSHEVTFDFYENDNEERTGFSGVKPAFLTSRDGQGMEIEGIIMPIRGE